MVPIDLPQDFRTLDTWCSTEQGVEPWDLMLRASRNVTDAILNEMRLIPEVKSILIVAGPGNNGGDGLCVARNLRTLSPDIHVSVLEVASSGTTTDLRSRARTDLPSDVEILSFDPTTSLDRFDVVVDAIIGNGGSEQVREPIPEVLQALELCSAFRIALDVPTGLNCSTGIAHENTFRADVTVTISAEKRGFWLQDGPSVTGRIVVVPLGVDGAEERLPRDVVRLTSDDIPLILPARPARYSKFDAGRVVVIGGTVGMPGAPSLTAHAALRSGAGLVHLLAPRIHPLTPREVIVHELARHADGTISEEAFHDVMAIIERVSVVAVGPGLGSNTATLGMLARVIDSIADQLPVVIDADGLRLLPLLKKLHHTMIFTPHRGEYARMVGVSHTDLGANPLELTREWTANNPGVLHLKDTPSVTSNGAHSVLTVNGTPRMATAGSGDVLTGIIAGIVAQGADPLWGTALAAFVHAEAGSNASGPTDQPILASDMLQWIPSVLRYSSSG